MPEHTYRDAGVDIGLITDVALDEYSSDGQDGLVRGGEILNDETVAVLMQQSLYLAAAAQERVAHQVEVLRPHVNVV